MVNDIYVKNGLFEKNIYIRNVKFIIWELFYPI